MQPWRSLTASGMLMAAKSVIPGFDEFTVFAPLHRLFNPAYCVIEANLLLHFRPPQRLVTIAFPVFAAIVQCIARGLRTPHSGNNLPMRTTTCAAGGHCAGFIAQPATSLHGINSSIAHGTAKQDAPIIYPHVKCINEFQEDSLI